MNKGESPIFILVVVLVLVVYAFWSVKQNPVSTVDISQPINFIENTNNGGVNVAAPATTISYTQALAKYKDARIQLDQNCRAHPNNVTYKNNTNIMVDNRADLSRTVKVGSTFSIQAYGFKIVRLSSVTLPVTWYIDCDTSQNVATILIQN